MSARSDWGIRLLYLASMLVGAAVGIELLTTGTYGYAVLLVLAGLVVWLIEYAVAAAIVALIIYGGVT